MIREIDRFKRRAILKRTETDLFDAVRNIQRCEIRAVAKAIRSDLLERIRKRECFHLAELTGVYADDRNRQPVDGIRNGQRIHVRGFETGNLNVIRILLVGARTVGAFLIRFLSGIGRKRFCGKNTVSQ